MDLYVRVDYRPVCLFDDICQCMSTDIQCTCSSRSERVHGGKKSRTEQVAFHPRWLPTCVHHGSENCLQEERGSSKMTDEDHV